VPPRGGRSSSSTRPSAAAVVQAVELPCADEGTLSVGDALEGLRRLLTAAENSALSVEDVLAEPQAQSFLASLGAACKSFSPQDVRQVLVAFARVQHMPLQLWQQGLAEEVSRSLEELPDLHVVHVALLVASLDLDEPLDLLQDLAEQLEIRAHTLSPTGMAGALVALSQLGPWPSSSTAGLSVAEELLQRLDELSPRELSASALAAATLGIRAQTFWQRLHGALLARINELEPKHIADATLAVATNRLLPIFLLEAIQDRLPHVVGQMEPDEALTTVWALASLQIFPPKQLPRLLEQILPADVPASQLAFAPAEARQLRQVAMSLELEPSAAKASAEVSASLRSRLRAASESARLVCEPPSGDEAVAEEVCATLMEVAPLTVFSVGEIVKGLYSVDLALTVPPSADVDSAAARRGVVLDAASPEDAQAPRDPWVTLKLRHLSRLGWSIQWLPAQRWRTWDEEERIGFVRGLLPDKERT